MAAIKGAMPQFFALNVASIIKATTDKGEHVAMLARAFTGAALERAQFGNAPALSGADSALESVKGKATKQRIDNALSHVRVLHPTHLRHDCAYGRDRPSLHRRAAWPQRSDAAGAVRALDPRRGQRCSEGRPGRRLVAPNFPRISPEPRGRLTEK